MSEVILLYWVGFGSGVCVMGAVAAYSSQTPNKGLIRWSSLRRIEEDESE